MNSLISNCKKVIILLLLSLVFVSAHCQVTPIKRNTGVQSLPKKNNKTINRTVSNQKKNRKSYYSNKGSDIKAKIMLDYNMSPGNLFHPFENKEYNCRDKYKLEKERIASSVTKQFTNEILTSNELAKNNIALFKEKIENIVSDNTISLYDREFENPLILHVRIFYHREINNLLHKLIQVPSVRSWMVTFVGKYLQTMCKKLPKDFSKKLIRELKIMYAYVDEMKNHKYTTKPTSWYEQETLLIDGKKAEDIALKSQGFIIRRVIYDDIPKEEIKRSILKIIKMVKSVNIENNPDVMLKCNINNEITYYMTSNGAYFIINATQEKIPAYWNMRVRYEEVYGKGKYYFEHGYYSYRDEKWEPTKKDEDFVIDSSGKRF